MKNIYKSIKLLLLGGMVAGMSSCSDFLEPKATSEFVPKDATSLNELLLGEAYPTTNTSNLEAFLHLFDDDIARSPYQITPIGFDLERYYAPFTWQSDMWERMRVAGAGNVDIYYAHYRKILGCNAILDYIGQVSDTEEKINEVKAQAYALRGFYYLHLVNVFGMPYNYDPNSLGVPLKKSSNIENTPLVRNTVAECYDLILSDLLEAERLYETMPASMQWKPTYRTNLPMVQLLLSRTYLYMENWEKAALYASKVMENKNFKLLDLNTVPDKNPNNPSSPMYMDYNSYDNSTETIWVYGKVSDMGMWLTDYAETENGYIYPYFMAAPALMSALRETPGDLRESRYVIRSWKSFPEVDAEGNSINVRMPQAAGKINVDLRFLVAGTSSTFGRSLRLSEAYLNYAEAKCMAGKSAEAMTALNTLRRFRFAPETYAAVNLSDQESVLKFVKNERRRELCYEGHRWFDLRRWGMEEIEHVWCDDENSNSVYKLRKNDPLFAVPLPDTALELNADLKQNPLAEIPRKGEKQN